MPDKSFLGDIVTLSNVPREVILHVGRIGADVAECPYIIVFITVSTPIPTLCHSVGLAVEDVDITDGKIFGGVEDGRSRGAVADNRDVVGGVRAGK